MGGDKVAWEGTRRFWRVAWEGTRRFRRVQIAKIGKTNQANEN